MKHIPRKRFGQHFLTDTGLIEAIADAIDPKPGQPLVEIGPGLGALTRPVLQRCGRLTVIELDRDLAARLRAWPGLQIIEADVLGVDWHAVQVQTCGHAGSPPGTSLRVVGNLPYNISTPILFHLLEAAALVQDQHFMLQSEVVDRMVSGPGTKAYGRLSVMLQWRYAMERVLDVPPQAFDPPPAVDSAVVRMQPLATPALADAALLSELVTVAFSQRRKLLRHTLGRWLEQKSFTGTFDTQRRAEEVPVSEFVDLAQTLGC
jgi:16S rRNA (adenine1518-N6/adenine1519-N6)-dimethyltransferase